MYLLIVLGLYLALGMFYNIKKNNLSGKEAVPHIDFWRSFPELVQEGVHKTLDTGKKTALWVKGKVKGENPNYNEL